MNNNKRILLEKYVRVAIKKAIQEQEAAQKRAEKSMYLIQENDRLNTLPFQLSFAVIRLL